MSDEVLISTKGSIATVTLNRPSVHNALNVRTYERLPRIFKQIDEDPKIKVMILRGAGGKAFASGADITEFERERGNAAAAKVYNEKVANAEQTLEGMGKPTIAMIHGYCIGGGAGLALACDIRFADENARFAITPAKLGLVYSLESTRRLVELVGPSRSKWILMSGLPLGASRCLELGLFDEVFEKALLQDATVSLAETISTRAQVSVRAAKEMVRRVALGQVRDDAETIDIRNSSFDTEDFKEGVKSFLAKRAPNFK